MPGENRITTKGAVGEGELCYDSDQPSGTRMQSTKLALLTTSNSATAKIHRFFLRNSSEQIASSDEHNWPRGWLTLFPLK
jgi:hypothetical protein